MIALLVAAVAMQDSPVRVLELVEPSAPYIVVQANIKAPAQMSAREATAWQVLGRLLLLGTVEYTPFTIRDYGSQAGIPPSVTVMPDFMRLELVVPKGGLSLAGQFLYAMLTRPGLREEDIEKVMSQLESEEQSAWVSALVGIDYTYDKLRQGDVQRLWEHTFRPANINIVVGGVFDPGAAKKEMDYRFSAWKPNPDPGPLRFDTGPSPRLSVPGGVSAFYLQAKSMTPASQLSAARLLSVFALGVGRDSSMTRVLRNKLGLSYLQGAVLWPTRDGWRPTFLMVRKTENGEAKYSTQMKEALGEDVKTWTDETLVRAKAMARAAFERTLPDSPIWLGPNGPMGRSLSDHCAWRGYLEMVGSGSLREETMLSAMDNVDLDQLKEAATQTLDESNVGWLPGRP
ncbi:MAG TPA: hypothetical protein VNI20_09475 [Fimbriimonadaceae bacterium]|nr:hypothetical protein [Fimbriimonadaceae bacterium]